ncbi:glutamyl-tRNA reductase [Naumannella halotolerans]|uniref:Glutamyl-tRNA reductase n=1 Tax=Naumannella halotolerans TaxID=993414 RepID=A0A4R7J0T0_9ACTN|nr:glutamyl-tRNA reductase [Naumannella halotolerans]TDT29986.1 glutamyl-tRNA reductase [Naumannella halotolerans]
MSILALSASHHTASLDLLAELTLVPDQRAKVLTELERSAYVDEALVLSTCNRTEIYAAVSRFHGGLEELAGALSLVSGVPLTALQSGCAVSYDERAVQHAFSVASGMDSMVRGEQQILGQVRSALTEGQRAGTVGTSLNSLFQQALRVGKRVQHETAAGAAGRSLVTAAFDQIGDLAGRRTVIIGAGTMSSMAAATAAAAGADLVLVNRTRSKAERLAGTLGAQVRDLSELRSAIADAEVLISCTGGRDLQLGVDDLLGSGLRTVVDLALPADIAPEVAEIPGLRLINLASLAEGGYDAASEDDLADAMQLVADEVADFLAARRAAAVTPTVVALRTMASEILDAELSRLQSRTPELSEAERAEVGKSMRRVVEKLLHQPTVRVRQLSSESDTDYAGALRELFALDPQTVRAVGGGDLGRE